MKESIINSLQYDYELLFLEIFRSMHEDSARHFFKPLYVDGIQRNYH